MIKTVRVHRLALDRAWPGLALPGLAWLGPRYKRIKYMTSIEAKKCIVKKSSIMGEYPLNEHITRSEDDKEGK